MIGRLGTGVNPAGDAGDTSPRFHQYFGWRRQWEYVLLDKAAPIHPRQMTAFNGFNQISLIEI